MARTKKILKTLTPLALGLAAWAPEALAQDNQNLPTRRDTFQDWSLACFANDAGGEVCNISQAFVNNETNNAMMRVIVRQQPGGDGNIMIVALPLGVDLRAGASLQVKDDRVINNLTYTMCLPDGCRVQFQLNDEVLDEMRTASDGRFIFRRPNVQQAIGIPVSFNGFAEAYAALLGTQ